MELTLKEINTQLWKLSRLWHERPLDENERDEYDYLTVKRNELESKQEIEL